MINIDICLIQLPPDYRFPEELLDKTPLTGPTDPHPRGAVRMCHVKTLSMQSELLTLVLAYLNNSEQDDLQK